MYAYSFIDSLATEPSRNAVYIATRKRKWHWASSATSCFAQFRLKRENWINLLISASYEKIKFRAFVFLTETVIDGKVIKTRLKSWKNF